MAWANDGLGNASTSSPSLIPPDGLWGIVHVVEVHSPSCLESDPMLKKQSLHFRMDIDCDLDLDPNTCHFVHLDGEQSYGK